jgi:hypothetical protein
VLSLKKHFHLTTHIRYFEYGSLATFGARFEKKKTLQYLVMLQYPPESQGSCRGQAFLVRAFSFSFSFHILFFYFLSRDPFKPGRYLPCPGYSRSGAIRCRLGCTRSIEEKKRGTKKTREEKKGGAEEMF